MSKENQPRVMRIAVIDDDQEVMDEILETLKENAEKLGLELDTVWRAKTPLAAETELADSTNELPDVIFLDGNYENLKSDGAVGRALGETIRTIFRGRSDSPKIVWTSDSQPDARNIDLIATKASFLSSKDRGQKWVQKIFNLFSPQT